MHARGHPVMLWTYNELASGVFQFGTRSCSTLKPKSTGPLKAAALQAHDVFHFGPPLREDLWPCLAAALSGSSNGRETPEPAARPRRDRRPSPCHTRGTALRPTRAESKNSKRASASACILTHPDHPRSPDRRSGYEERARSPKELDPLRSWARTRMGAGGAPRPRTRIQMRRISSLKPPSNRSAAARKSNADVAESNNRLTVTANRSFRNAHISNNLVHVR
jgi:hypothetical protein